jgi:hypothetical protein
VLAHAYSDAGNTDTNSDHHPDADAGDTDTDANAGNADPDANADNTDANTYA